jgi:CBS domain-containing protein
MLCEEVMKREVEFVDPKERIERAARLMRDNDVGFLPVCDEKRQVVGTLTDRDIVVRGIAEGRDGKDRVQDVMTDDVVGCQPTDDIRRAEQLMSEHKITRMLCLDDVGRLLGVLSLSDLAPYQEEEATSATYKRVKEAEEHPPH